MKQVWKLSTVCGIVGAAVLVPTTASADVQSGAIECTSSFPAGTHELIAVSPATADGDDDVNVGATIAYSLQFTPDADWAATSDWTIDLELTNLPDVGSPIVTTTSIDATGVGPLASGVPTTIGQFDHAVVPDDASATASPRRSISRSPSVTGADNGDVPLAVPGTGGCEAVTAPRIPSAA